MVMRLSKLVESTCTDTHQPIDLLTGREKAHTEIAAGTMGSLK